MANDMAPSGRNGPPIFPIGVLAVRVKYTSPGKNFCLQGALTDGVPGDPNNPYGTHIKLGNGDGTLSIVEFGHTPQEGEPPFDVVKPVELIESEQKIHMDPAQKNAWVVGMRLEAVF